jgi:hypothetical protein
VLVALDDDDAAECVVAAALRSNSRLRQQKELQYRRQHEQQQQLYWTQLHVGLKMVLDQQYDNQKKQQQLFGTIVSGAMIETVSS